LVVAAAEEVAIEVREVAVATERCSEEFVEETLERRDALEHRYAPAPNPGEEPR
jgi:hypothetical protein